MKLLMRKFQKLLNNQLSNRLIKKNPQENDEATLRRSIGVRKLAIPNDYIVCLQGLDYNIGAENDP